MNKGTQKRRKVMSKLKNTDDDKVEVTGDNFLRKCKDNIQRTWLQTAECSFAAKLRLNRILLKEDVHQEVNDYVKNKINVDNVSTFYQLSSIFTSSNILQTAFNYIERGFSVVSETKNFLELDYKQVLKIFRSSNLNVSLELEVCKAAEAWINHNKRERTRFALKILSKIRLPLIAEHELRCLLKDNSSFAEVEDCVGWLKRHLNKKNKLICKTVGLDFTNQYCKEILYEVVFIGGWKNQNSLKNSNHVNGRIFGSAREIPAPLIHHRLNAVSLKGEIYLFLDFSIDFESFVAKYSKDSNSWVKVADMRAVRLFCCCAYMDKVVILGGENMDGSSRDFCLQFDTISCEWSKIQRMKRTRVEAACAIFRGKITVAGGIRRRSVESYNGVKWSLMASMNSALRSHSLVVVRNSMYVIGCFLESCEVYDDVGKKFVFLKTPSNQYHKTRAAFSVGSKIVAIQGNYPYIMCYDVDTNEWKKEPFEFKNGLIGFYCVKVPLL